MSDQDRTDSSFARLVAESRDSLTRYVQRLLRRKESAEDIVQEAYLRTYTHSDPGRGPLQPYLFTIARNLAFKAHRHERIVDEHIARLDPSSSSDSLEDAESSAEASVLAAERLRLLKDAIGALPPQCRTAFTLRMFHDRSYKEIAAQLDISPKTVEKHIATGTAQVCATLARRYKDVK